MEDVDDSNGSVELLIDREGEVNVLDEDPTSKVVVTDIRAVLGG